MNVLMDIRTYQARCRRVSGISRIVTRISVAISTMVLAGLTVVGTSTHAGVGFVTEAQIAQQILTVQGQDVLARLMPAIPVTDVPQPGPASQYTPSGASPQLVASLAVSTGPGIDPTTTMAERTLYVQREVKLTALPKRRGKAQWQCLAEALYFEARSESEQGQSAVAEVILNRVDSRKYPDTVCEVVSQGAEKLNACQFSYNCDGRPERITEPRAYATAKAIALKMVASGDRSITDGATHYHTKAVRPSWSRKMTETARIGTHIFYRDNTVVSRR